MATGVRQMMSVNQPVIVRGSLFSVAVVGFIIHLIRSLSHLFPVYFIMTDSVVHRSVILFIREFTALLSETKDPVFCIFFLLACALLLLVLFQCEPFRPKAYATLMLSLIQY